MDIIYLDVLQHNTTSSLVLVFHQLLGVFTFLVRRVLEELVKSWQSHIVPIEVQSLYDRYGNYRHTPSTRDNYVSHVFIVDKNPIIIIKTATIYRIVL